MEYTLRQRVGLILAPVVFFAFLLFPFYPSNPFAHKALAIFVTIVVLWVTEGIPLPFSALLIPVLAIILGLLEPKDAFSNFSNPIIFLFLGSFVIAKAMSHHGLDKRIALWIISKKWVNTPSRTLLAIGGVTTFLSMWISNTATTAMIYPISWGIYTLFSKNWEAKEARRFGIAIMLVSAYASSIGGVGTPVGTPPNLIAIGFLEKFSIRSISFFQWMALAFPGLIAMFFIMFLILRGRGFKGGIEKDEFLELVSEKLNKGEKAVLSIFLLVVFLWVFPGLAGYLFGKNQLVQWLQNSFPESSVAIIGAILTVLIPLNWKKGEFVLPFREAISIDWGTLLLFGGGLTLGDIFFKSGIGKDIGELIRANFPVGSVLTLSIIFYLFSIFLTEFMSNTAAVNLVVPIAISISNAFGIDPIIPVISSSFGGSFAFVFPVSTPPNAIIYSSGLVPLPSMIKKGILLDLAGMIICPLLILWVKIIA